MVTPRQADANIASVVSTCSEVSNRLTGIDESIRSGRLDTVQTNLLDARRDLNRALRIVRSRGFGPRLAVSR